ncbi:MAG: ASKHA domain-containing protein, partial [Candidatus Omnitrophica bacterium]|nr:ASKHA domain-containing protein [Candidatus Omnitrophota bacterium]
KIFIAGGFGTYINIEHAINIGLLPDLDLSRFIFVGNSSLAGARQILLSYEAMKKVNEIAKKITYFELSVEPSYMDEYMAALFFPHTDLKKFPNVGL